MYYYYALPMILEEAGGAACAALQNILTESYTLRDICVPRLHGSWSSIHAGIWLITCFNMKYTRLHNLPYEALLWSILSSRGVIMRLSQITKSLLLVIGMEISCFQPCRDWLLLVGKGHLLCVLFYDGTWWYCKCHCVCSSWVVLTVNL